MHRPKTERQALAQRLLGTASEPGPLDVGWLKRRLGVKGGSYIKRWRENGIPEARRQDVEQAIAELMGTAKAPPPEWAGAMESRIVSEVRANREALYARLADEAAMRALRLAGLLPDEPTDETPDQPPESGAPSKGPTL